MMEIKNKFMATCTYDHDCYVLSIEESTKFSEIFYKLNKRWDNLNDQHAVVKYYTPTQKRRVVSLLNDEDVSNMCGIHASLSAKYIEMFVICRPEDSKLQKATVEIRSSTSNVPSVPRILTSSTAMPEDVPRFRKANEDANMQLNLLREWKQCIKGVGQQFDNAQHFREVLCTYCIANGHDYSFIRNEKDRITVCCPDKNCNWRIHASESRKDKYFAIKTVNLQHTCDGGFKNMSHVKATLKRAATLSKLKVETIPLYNFH